LPPPATGWRSGEDVRTFLDPKDPEGAKILEKIRELEGLLERDSVKEAA